MGRDQRQLYDLAVRDFGRALDRLAAGYEADPERRHDLRQEIHMQLWRSLAAFDGRCSVKTWTFRVAHNTAVSYVNRERRNREPLVGLEEIERTGITADLADLAPEIDRRRALSRLSDLIRTLKPLDRQIMISYLEEMDAADIADITGLTTANVAAKIHRIKNLLSRRFVEDQRHAG